MKNSCVFTWYLTVNFVVQIIIFSFIQVPGVTLLGFCEGVYWRKSDEIMLHNERLTQHQTAGKTIFLTTANRELIKNLGSWFS